MTSDAMAKHPGPRNTRTFPLILIIVVIAIIVAGFGHTFSRVVLHPSVAPPTILYVHVGLAASWLACLLVQSSLITADKRMLHRRLGVAFVGLGGAMSVVAFFTAIALRRVDTIGDPIENLAYLSIPLAAWLLFTVPFVLAIVWRRHPSRHRPLMLIAACALTGPALGRFPEIRHAGLYLTGLIPVIMMAGAMIDERLGTRRWSVIYLAGMGLTLVVAGVAVYLEIAHPPEWIATVRWLLTTF